MSGSCRFFPSSLQSCRDGLGPLAVRLLFGYATFNGLLLSAAKPHQPPVQPDKHNTTGTAGSPNTAHVLCLTPQSQMLSIRFTLMDSLRYRLNRHVLVTYDWFCPEEAHNIDQTGSADLFGTLPGTVRILALIWVNILQNG